MATQLFNYLEVPVINRLGQYLGRDEIINNSQLPELYPAESVVIIDWDASDVNKPDANERGKFNKDAWQKGVEYKGILYYPLYYGPAIKKGSTLGVTHDFLVEDDLMTKVEQRCYSKRHLLAAGRNGGLKGDITVLVVEDGTKVGGHLCYDGGGLISQSAWDLGNNGHQLIHLTEQRPSYSVTQWLPNNDEIWAEIEPMISKGLMDAIATADDDGGQKLIEFAYKRNYLSSLKADMIAAWPEEMELHPAVASVLGKGAADIWARIATAIPFENVHNRVAIPIWLPKGELVTVPGLHGWHASLRQPLDAPAIHVRDMKDHPELHKFIKLITVQCSLSTPEVFIKPVVRVVPDDILPPGVDVVINVSDVKMGSLKPGIHILHDAVMPFIGACDPESTCGLNPVEGKFAMGADFDWDMVALVVLFLTAPATGQRTLLKAVKAGYESLELIQTKKVPKTCNPITEENDLEFAAQNFHSSLVGMYSTGLMNARAVGNDETAANWFEFRDKTSMFKAFNTGIKVGTDSQKRKLCETTTYAEKPSDPKEEEQWRKRFNVEKQMQRIFGLMRTLRTRLGQEYGIFDAKGDPYAPGAPFIKWHRGKFAFVVEAPRIGWDDNWTPEQKEAALPDWWQGLCARIARHTIPVIGDAFAIQIKANPPSHYANWVGSAKALPIQESRGLFYWFIGRLNAEMTVRKADPFSDIEDTDNQSRTEAFRQLCQAKFDHFIAQKGLDRTLVAKALWYMAHNASDTTTATAPFFLCWEESMKIIAEAKQNAALGGPIKAVGTGFAFQWPTMPRELSIKVEVSNEIVEGKRRQVVIPVMPVKELKPSKMFPQGNVLGLISKESGSVDGVIKPGQYNARISQNGKASWLVELHEGR